MTSFFLASVFVLLALLAFAFAFQIPSSTPHDEHIVQDADFGFSLPEATVAAALKSDRDPAEAFCDKVMSAETIQEFAKATFPPDLFDGFSDEATIEKTMHNLLDAMVADKRTHRELAIHIEAPL